MLAFGAGGWFLWRTAQRSWGTLGLPDLQLAWLPILAGSGLTAATYLYLVFVWVASLRWWNARFAYLDAARVWFVSNLARFIPGMIWQLAGVATLAQTQGVSPLAATGGVLLQQVVLVVTGTVVAAAWAPALLAHWAGRTASGSVLGLALIGTLALVLTFPRALPAVGRLVSRALRRPVSWPVVPTRQFALYVTGLVLPWVVYGIAFWLFGRGLLGPAAPGFSLAVGGFVASYVAGLIVVFAPSGLVVREAALVAALSPALGGGRALILALASRLWLLAVELLTALAVVAFHAAGRRRSRP